MNNLQALVGELKKITSQLVTFIDEQNIEPALELVERRLIILESLQNMFNSYPELRADIQRLATEVLSYEQSSIMLLSEMKNNIADQLAELAKANKADLAYRNVNSK